MMSYTQYKRYEKNILCMVRMRIYTWPIWLNICRRIADLVGDVFMWTRPIQMGHDLFLCIRCRHK